MQDPGRAVPGRTEIPFHIGIISEHLSGIIEGDVEGVPQTRSDQFPAGAFRIHLGDPAAVRFHGVVVSVGILDQREEVIEFAVRDIAVGIHLRDLGEVARHDVDGLLVWRQHDAVGAVFAGSLQVFQQGDLIELVISVGVLQTVKSAGLFQIVVTGVVHHHIQTVEGVEQSLGVTHGNLSRILLIHEGRIALHFQLFGPGFGDGIADGRYGDPVEVSVLVGGDNPAFRVEGHGHPGTLFMFGRTIEPFGPEARGELEFRGFGVRGRNA